MGPELKRRTNLNSVHVKTDRTLLVESFISADVMLLVAVAVVVVVAGFDVGTRPQPPTLPSFVLVWERLK